MSLLKQGFEVVDTLETPESFGNTRVVLASSHLWLRVTSDRGQIFVDAREGQDTVWYSVAEVLALASVRVPERPWNDADSAVRDYRDNEALVRAAMADDAEKERLVGRR